MRRKIYYVIYPFLLTLCISAGFFAYPIYEEHFNQFPQVINISNQENIAEVTSEVDAHRILDRAVRIQTPLGSGSGVIVFSEEHPTKKDRFLSYIITNRHVVRSFPTVGIQKFNYFDHRTIRSIETYSGDVIARTSVYDLAIVELTTDKKLPTATLITRPEFEAVKLFDDVYLGGCPLGSNPLVSHGQLADIQPNKMLTTAFAIFGSSGGGMYLKDGSLLGVVNQVAKYKEHDTDHAVPNLSYVIPVNVIVAWIRSKRLGFIYSKDRDGFTKFIRKRETRSRF